MCAERRRKQWTKSRSSELSGAFFFLEMETGSNDEPRRETMITSGTPLSFCDKH